MKTIIRKRTGVALDPRQRWYEAAKSVAIKIASSADVVVSTFGPPAAHQLAKEMKISNPSLCWVADYRDLWADNRNLALADAERIRLRNQELSCVKNYADVITTVSKDLANRLCGLLKQTVRVVPNGFDMDEDVVAARLARPIERPNNGPLRIVYTGMIYRGSQNPEPLLKALVKLRKQGALLEGMVTIDFYGARVEVARELAKNSDYAPFIRLMGHVSRSSALRAQENAGFLLLLESSAPEARGVLTGKVFEYIISGRPILCVGSHPEYEIGQLLNATGTGVVMGPNQIADIAALINATLNGKGLYSSYKPNIENIVCYSRRRSSECLFRLIQSRN